MGKEFGKYTLDRRLGGGGMAEVFRARLHGPEGFEKDIALKLILPHFSSEPEFVEMFIGEATLAARLDHANIVRIHEFDQVEGRYYIAMELVDGKDLRRLMARSREIDRPLSIPESVSIALEVCKGLAFAHGELTPGSPEVVHRDISPHNIIVSKAGEVKITDFGIAKLVSAAGITRTGVIKGKAAYMSPEQARGEPVDKRSDLFSLGCVLWELLTGQRLFTGDNDMAIMRKIQQDPIHPPSRYDPEVGEDLDAVVLKLLARDPDQRYASTAEAAAQLEKLEGPGRSTRLVDLYRDLFSDLPEGTGKMPAVGGSSTQGSVVPTVSAKLESSPPHKPRRLRVLAVAITVLVLGAVAAIVATLLKEPGEVPAPSLKPRAEAAAPGPPPPVEIQPEEGEETGEAEPAAIPAEEPDQEPAPVPEQPPVKKPTGRLYLNAIPWAKVYRGKKFLGDTPLENLRLPVGRHRFRLVNSELKVTRNVWVVISKNRTTREVVNLKGK